MTEPSTHALVVFDVDNTVVRGQSQHLFLNYLFARRIIGPIFYVRVLVWFALYKVGLASHPERIMRYAYSFLKGRPALEIEALMDDFFTTILRDRIFGEALRLIAEHQQAGREVILLSNAPDFIISKLAAHLHIRDVLATPVITEHGVYTGMIGAPLYGSQKVEAIESFGAAHGHDLKSAIAYADHSSDIPLLLAVGHPIAVNPTSSLRAAAHAHHWPVLHFA